MNEKKEYFVANRLVQEVYVEGLLRDSRLELPDGCVGILYVFRTKDKGNKWFNPCKVEYSKIITTEELS